MTKFPYFDNFTLKKSGYKINKLKSKKPLKLMNEILDDEFKDNFDNLNLNSFRKKLLVCQDRINKEKIHYRIIEENKNFFLKLFKVKSLRDLSVQSVVYLRGVRPHTDKKSEYIEFHRENFYNDFDYINHQLNIHMPVKNYTLKSSMKYIPKSHLISDKKIRFLKLNSSQSGIKRFSVSHKIGLPYNPKKITKGIDTNKSRRFNINQGELVAFSSRLIHGGGYNEDTKVRFSIDFGLIKKKIVIKKNKKFHFSSYHIDKKHYVDI